MTPADKPRPDLRVVSSAPEQDTDRPAEERVASPGTPAPPKIRVEPPRPVAVVQRPPSRLRLYFRLFAVYASSAAVTCVAVVGGWWVLIGPTDRTPPPPEVRVERVEVPVLAPAPPPEVVYVEVPAEPIITPPRTVFVDRPVVAVAPPPPPPPVEDVVKEPPPPPPPPSPPPPKVAPPAATAHNGVYEGKTGSGLGRFELTFLPDDVVRAVVIADDDDVVGPSTVTGRYELAPDGSATIALFMGDVTYAGLVANGRFDGRVSQGGKSKGKLSVRR